MWILLVNFYLHFLCFFEKNSNFSWVFAKNEKCKDFTSIVPTLNTFQQRRFEATFKRKCNNTKNNFLKTLLFDLFKLNLTDAKHKVCEMIFLHQIRQQSANFLGERKEICYFNILLANIFFLFSVHYLNVWYCLFRISWKIGKNPQFNSTKTMPKSTKNYGQTLKRNPKLYNELIRNKRNQNLAMNKHRYIFNML